MNLLLTETDKESDMTDKQLEQEAENRFPLYKYPLQHIAFKEGIAFALSNVVGQSEQLFKLRDNCVNGVDDEVCRNSGICKYCS